MAKSCFVPFFWTKNTFPNEPRPMTLRILKLFLVSPVEATDLLEEAVEL